MSEAKVAQLLTPKRKFSDTRRFGEIFDKPCLDFEGFRQVNFCVEQQMGNKLYFGFGCHTNLRWRHKETKDAGGNQLDGAKRREIFKLAAEGRSGTSIHTGTCEM